MNEINHRLLNQLVAYIGTLLIAVYLTGCASTKTFPPTVVTSAPRKTILTEQILPTGTATSRPPTILVSPGSTDLPTLTPKPKTVRPPVRTEAEALAFIVSMQETNGDCELPCWWGITPGETSEQVAKQVLSPLRNFAGLRSDIGFHLKEYADIDASIYADGKNVKEIWVFSSIPDDDQSTRYHPSWQRYSLSELLTRLGTPSQVLIGFGLHTGDHDERPSESIPYYYELHAIYGELGLVVRYAGPAIRGDRNRACLSLDSLKDVRIFIRQRSAGPLEGPPWEAFTGEPALSLPKVTNLSLKEFYETFKDPNNQKCLESPAKYWP